MLAERKVGKPWIKRKKTLLSRGLDVLGISSGGGNAKHYFLLYKLVCVVLLTCSFLKACFAFFKVVACLSQIPSEAELSTLAQRLHNLAKALLCLVRDRY